MGNCFSESDIKEVHEIYELCEFCNVNRKQNKRCSKCYEFKIQNDRCCNCGVYTHMIYNNRCYECERNRIFYSRINWKFSERPMYVRINLTERINEWKKLYEYELKNEIEQEIKNKKNNLEEIIKIKRIILNNNDDDIVILPSCKAFGEII
jgi:hypothetical protein